MGSIKITISIAEQLKTELDEYNNENPYRKINISQLAQHAIHIELQKRKAEGVKQHGND